MSKHKTHPHPHLHKPQKKTWKETWKEPEVIVFATGYLVIIPSLHLLLPMIEHIIYRGGAI